MGSMGSLGFWGGPTDAAGRGRDPLCQVTLAGHRTFWDRGTEGGIGGQEEPQRTNEAWGRSLGKGLDVS